MKEETEQACDSVSRDGGGDGRRGEEGGRSEGGAEMIFCRHVGDDSVPDRPIHHCSTYCGHGGRTMEEQTCYSLIILSVYSRCILIMVLL